LSNNISYYVTTVYFITPARKAKIATYAEEQRVHTMNTDVYIVCVFV